MFKITHMGSQELVREMFCLFFAEFGEKDAQVNCN